MSTGAGGYTGNLGNESSQEFVVRSRTIRF
nr:MAG TPA: hypothetical protein [Caudoviricetes sp.]